MKRSASLDTSFWINAYRIQIHRHLSMFFQLLAAPAVQEEVLHPLMELGIEAEDALEFTEWVKAGKIAIKVPRRVQPLFHPGESQAIALAHEEGCLLLIDDSNPYEAARRAGIQVIGSPDFLVFLTWRRQIEAGEALSRLEGLRRSVTPSILETARRHLEQIRKRR